MTGEGRKVTGEGRTVTGEGRTVTGVPRRFSRHCRVSHRGPVQTRGRRRPPGGARSVDSLSLSLDHCLAFLRLHTFCKSDPADSFTVGMGECLRLRNATERRRNEPWVCVRTTQQWHGRQPTYFLAAASRVDALRSSRFCRSLSMFSFVMTTLDADRPIGLWSPVTFSLSIFST